MMLTRRVLTTLVAAGLVFGGAACGKVAEKATEKAIEESSNCENIDISDAGASGECDGQSFDANADGDAELPEGFPAELAPPADAQIVTSFGSQDSYSVTAGLDGDRTEVADGIQAQLESAGYTIDDVIDADNGSGATTNITATGPDYTANVAVTEVENAVEGNLTIVYSLTAVTG